MVDYNVANIRVRSLRTLPSAARKGSPNPSVCGSGRVRIIGLGAGHTFLSDDHALLEAFLILALDVSYVMVNQRCRSGSIVNIRGGERDRKWDHEDDLCELGWMAVVSIFHK